MVLMALPRVSTAPVPQGALALTAAAGGSPGLRLPQHVERRCHVQPLPLPLGGSSVRIDADPGRLQARHGRRQRLPGTLPARRRRHRRQRLAIRAQELELPRAVRDHLKALLMHRAVVEAAPRSQVGKLRLPAVGPMHHVMGVAVAGTAAGELTLVAIPALQGTA